MIDVHELKQCMNELEEAPSSWRNYERLAALYVINDHCADGTQSPQSEKRSTPRATNVVGVHGDSDFLKAVAGANPATAWAVMDGLMDTLHTVNVRIYDTVMRQLSGA